MNGQLLKIEGAKRKEWKPSLCTSWKIHLLNFYKSGLLRDEVFSICLQLQQTVKHEYPA